MAAICYSGSILAVSRNEQLLGEKRTCEKSQTDKWMERQTDYIDSARHADIQRFLVGITKLVANLIYPIQGIKRKLERTSKTFSLFLGFGKNLSLLAPKYKYVSFQLSLLPAYHSATTWSCTWTWWRYCWRRNAKSTAKSKKKQNCSKRKPEKITNSFSL